MKIYLNSKESERLSNNECENIEELLLKNPTIKEVEIFLADADSCEEPSSKIVLSPSVIIGNLVQLQNDVLEKDEENRRLRISNESLEEKVKWLRSIKQTETFGSSSKPSELQVLASEEVEGTTIITALARVINKIESIHVSSKSGMLFNKQKRARRDKSLISQSEYFELDYLKAELKKLGLEVRDPVAFFLFYGAELEISPSEKFDTQAYLAMNPDVKASGINPLLHYIKHGKAEGRVLF